uniref:Uncharacterized protein n=1 Tax=Anopheles maculatus TaxID=74869 RepID=A0A182S5P0_9DIPT
LVSGSSGTEQSDEKAHSPDDHDLGKGDGYTEGIPGPVTRLFVLANRGLSNLIQDLILYYHPTTPLPTTGPPIFPSATVTRVPGPAHPRRRPRFSGRQVTTVPSRSPMLFEASSPAMPTLPTIDIPGELSNVSARFANTMTGLQNDITNATQQSVAELQKELAVLKSLAAPLDTGFASGLDSLVAGFGATSAKPPPVPTKQQTTTPPPAQDEPAPFSLTSIFDNRMRVTHTTYTVNGTNDVE